MPSSRRRGHQDTGWRKVWNSIRGTDSRETGPSSPRKKPKPAAAGEVKAKEAPAAPDSKSAMKWPSSPRKNKPEVPLSDIVTNRITRLEDELQTVRRELHSVQQEITELRSKRPVESDKTSSNSPLPVEKIRRILGCGSGSSAKDSSGPAGLGGWLGSLCACPGGDIDNDGTDSEKAPLKEPKKKTRGLELASEKKGPLGAGVGYTEDDDKSSHGAKDLSLSAPGAAPMPPYSIPTASTQAPASASPGDFKDWNAGVTPPQSPTPNGSTPRNPMERQPLPPPQVPLGWTAEWSRGKNAYYYVNEATQESTWELPASSQRPSPRFAEPHTAPYSPPTILGSGSHLRSAAMGTGASSLPSSTWSSQARQIPAPPASLGTHQPDLQSTLRPVDDWPGLGSSAPPKRPVTGSSGSGGFQLPFPEAEDLDPPSPARGPSPGGNLAGQIASSAAPMQSAMRSSAQPGGAGRVRRLEFGDRTSFA